MTQKYSRRNVLGSVAGAIALAGCPKITADESTVGFQQVTVEGEQLVIELDSADSKVAITVIDPRGETYKETQIGVGATRETVHLGTTYIPGTYEIRAILDGETTAKTTLEIRPELEIVEIGIGVNHPERMPEDLPFPENQIFLVVKNSGTGPEAITNLGIHGDVPNPTPPKSNENSGIYAEEQTLLYADEVKVTPGRQVEFYSTSFPFGNSGKECSGEQLRIILETRASESRIQKTRSLDYQDEGEECIVTIGGGE